MQFFFVSLAFLSGLFGLSYEVIYQRLCLTIGGDLFGTYAIVVATFVLGMACGNAVGYRLRTWLASLEIANGALATAFGCYLLWVGYPVSLSRPLMIGLLFLPAFAVGTSIPLYSYYLRRISFRFFYAIYNLGAVAGILALEFFMLPVFPLSSFLIGIGATHILVGLVIYICYRKKIFIVEENLINDFSFVKSENKKRLFGVFLFSFASFFFSFWAIKAIYYTLLPLRLISSVAIAAGLFWIFVGTLIAEKKPSENKGIPSIYLVMFLFHMAALLWIMVSLPRAMPFFFIEGPYVGIAALTFLFLSPTLWASSFFMSCVNQSLQQQKTDIDTVSGLYLFVSSLGNVSGFALAAVFSFALATPVYFLPFLVLPLAFFIFAPSRLREALTVLAPSFVAIGICLVLMPAIYPRLVNANEVMRSIFVFPSLPEGKTFEQRFGQAVMDSIKINPDYMGIKSLNVSSSATITLRQVNPGAAGNPFMYLSKQFKKRIFFSLDGYVSHILKTPQEIQVGLLARRHFSARIPNSLVIGVGSGQTSAGVAMVSTQTDLVEISPLVLQALDVTREYNADVKNQPGVNIIQDDALNYLNETEKKYDAIINTSTSPFTVWAGKLYSVEFLRLIKSHMTPQGIYETWIDAEAITGLDVWRYINFLKLHFAHVDIHAIDGGYFILVCHDADSATEDLTDEALSDWGLAFKQANLKWFPDNSLLNRHNLLDVPSRPDVPPFAPTLDYPEIEIAALNRILSKKGFLGLDFGESYGFLLNKMGAFNGDDFFRNWE